MNLNNNPKHAPTFHTFNEFWVLTFNFQVAASFLILTLKKIFLKKKKGEEEETVNPNRDQPIATYRPTK